MEDKFTQYGYKILSLLQQEACGAPPNGASPQVIHRPMEE